MQVLHPVQDNLFLLDAADACLDEEAVPRQAVAVNPEGEKTPDVVEALPQHVLLGLQVHQIQIFHVLRLLSVCLSPCTKGSVRNLPLFPSAFSRIYICAI